MSFQRSPHIVEGRPYNLFDDSRPRPGHAALSQAQAGDVGMLSAPSDDPPDAVEIIDEDVAELQRQIERLQLRKCLVLAQRAPVRRVPPELLSRIFELGSRADVHFASTVCAVSTLWQSVAMASPAVWSNVCLGPEWGLGPEAFLRKVSVCLQRSQQSPLLVDIDLYYVDSVERAHALLATIAPHMSRCFSLSVCVPQPEWMELVVEHFGGQLAPRMEAMALRFRPSTPWGASYPQATIFEGELPILTSLTLEGLPLTILRAGLPGLRSLEYKQFEELYAYPQNAASTTPLADLLGLLETSPTLEELKIEFCNFSIDEADLAFDPDRPRVHLPALHSLTCAHIDAGYVTLFMESVDAPNLRRLSLRCDSIRQVQDVYWVPKAPMHNIRALELEGFRLMDGSALVAFLRLLHHMPLLTSLSILSPYSTQSTGQFFDVMALRTRTGGWLCPRLVDVSITNCHGLVGLEMLHLARARASATGFPSVAPLRRVAIRNCPNFDTSLLDELHDAVPIVIFAPPPSLPAIVPPSPMQWSQPVFFS